MKLLDRLFSIAGLEVLKLLMMPKKSFQIEMFKQPFVRCLEFWTALFCVRSPGRDQQKLSRRVTLQLMVIFGHDWSWVRNQQHKKRKSWENCAQEWDGQNHHLLLHHILNKKDVNNKRVSFFWILLGSIFIWRNDKKCMFGDWQLLIFLGQWKNVPWNLPEVDKKLIFRHQN